MVIHAPPGAFRELRLLNGSTGDPCLFVDNYVGRFGTARSRAASHPQYGLFALVYMMSEICRKVFLRCKIGDGFL